MDRHEFWLIAEVPFSNTLGGITEFLEALGDSDLIRIQADFFIWKKTPGIEIRGP